MVAVLALTQPLKIELYTKMMYTYDAKPIKVFNNMEKKQTLMTRVLERLSIYMLPLNGRCMERLLSLQHRIVVTVS